MADCRSQQAQPDVSEADGVVVRIGPIFHSEHPRGWEI